MTAAAQAQTWAEGFDLKQTDDFGSAQRLASQGWECIGVGFAGDTAMYVLQRPKQSPQDCPQ